MGESLEARVREALEWELDKWPPDRASPLTHQDDQELAAFLAPRIVALLLEPSDEAVEAALNRKREQLEFKENNAWLAARRAEMRAWLTAAYAAQFGCDGATPSGADRPDA